MSLTPADLLTEPPAIIESRTRALSAARAWSALEAPAAEAFAAQEAGMQETTETALSDMAAMGLDTRALERTLSPGPIARLFDRLRDALDDWRDRRDPDPDPTPAPGALLTATIPLARTRPYQDVPADYDDIDSTIDSIISDLARLISARPHWQERPLPRPVLPEDAFDTDDWDDDTDLTYQLALTRHLWQDGDTGALLFLQHVEDPDPKITGTQLSLGFLDPPDAAALLGHLDRL